MKKALILQLSRFGDILQTTPLLKNLKNKGFETFFFIDEKNLTLCKDIPVVDKTIPFKIGSFLSLLSQNKLFDIFFDLKDVIQDLNNNNFDILINLNHSEINLYISELLNISEKKGFKIREDNFIKFLYNIIANSRKLNPFNLVDVFNYFLKDFRVFNIQVRNDFPEVVNNLPDKYIVIHPGAGHPLRILDPEIVINFSNMFLEEFNDHYIILTGVKNEKELADKIYNNIKNKKVINLSGKTNYYQLKYVLKKSKLLISTDTGIMHLAAALNCKIVALFFASAFPYETGPYSESAVIITPAIECYPCKEFLHCNNFICKKIINEKVILNACKILLNNDIKKKDLENVILYIPFFDEYGIYLKEFTDKKDKFYEKRLNNRLKGLEILNENL